MSESKHTRGRGGNLPEGLLADGRPEERDPDVVRLMQHQVTEAFERPILGAAPRGQSLAEALAASAPQQSVNLDGIVTSEDAGDRFLSGQGGAEAYATPLDAGFAGILGDGQGDDVLGQGMLSLLMTSEGPDRYGDNESNTSILDDDDSPLL